MIIIDTGIWIDDLRSPDPLLASLILDLQGLLHPYVLGEIALGSLPRRDVYLRAMRQLPRPAVARQHEVARLIESENLHGSGVGFVDAHLLASCKLTPGGKLWTRDKRLLAQAQRLTVSHDL